MAIKKLGGKNGNLKCEANFYGLKEQKYENKKRS